MALTDDIEQLREDSLAALDASHDYYTRTKHVWRFVQQMVREGHRIAMENQATGSTVVSDELPRLAQEYVTGYLASATFQHFVSLFEDFVSGFLLAWLSAYPRSLEKRQLAFETVLDSTDKTEIIRAVVRKELIEITYKRVDEWFKYLDKIVHLGCPDEDQIKQLAEIKASRNVLVHNKGIVDAKYVEKSMGRARYQDDDMLEIPEQYHRDSWELIKQVVNDIADSGISKLQA